MPEKKADYERANRRSNDGEPGRFGHFTENGGIIYVVNSLLFCRADVGQIGLRGANNSQDHPTSVVLRLPTKTGVLLDFFGCEQPVVDCDFRHAPGEETLERGKISALVEMQTAKEDGALHGARHGSDLRRTDGLSVDVKFEASFVLLGDDVMPLIRKRHR